MELKSCLAEELARAETVPAGFKIKKGSVIPAKRRLVKKMMLDSFLKSISSVLSIIVHPCGSSKDLPSPENGCFQVERCQKL
ncbi:hypothetical protein SLEP1_g2127 [Rubroshorea leprosula]|uniref:Uncharacterized protein n=1 Tax=Rubroshorea leprosula TaxID=152421 RepID=A0AAV5HQM3_9ROSI|nr:hypothetical protein SLEP1_g2127 [Rubroshorea leprosula]